MRELLMLFPSNFKFVQAGVDVIQLISVKVEEDLVYGPAVRVENPERTEDPDSMEASDDENIQFAQPQQSSEYERLAAQMDTAMNMMTEIEQRSVRMADRQTRLFEIATSVDTLMDRVYRMNERMHELGDMLAEHRLVQQRRIDDLSLQMEAGFREDNHQMSELSARMGDECNL